MSTDGSVLRYEPVPTFTREEAVRQLSLGGREAASAIYSIALRDKEDAFAEAMCLQAIDSEDADLRYAAVGALGEMVYFASRTVDVTFAKARLIQLRSDHPELASRIDDALGDIELARSRNSVVDGGSI